MTRIDFYGLDDKSLDAGLRFACRLCDKALTSGHLVHVHTASQPQAERLDELMWDYPKHRFLPHARAGNQAQAPVQIGCGQPELDHGVLINLGSEIPAFFGRFDRVAEIVVGETREAGRDRYKYYRDRGHVLHHHELDNWER